MTWRGLVPFFGVYRWIQVIYVTFLAFPISLSFWPILCRLIVLSTDFNWDLGRIHYHFLLVFLRSLLRIRFLWFSDGHIFSWKLWRVAKRRRQIIEAASIRVHDSHAVSVISPIPLILPIWPSRVFAIPIVESLMLLLHSYMLRSRIWKRLHDLRILKLSQLVQLLVTALLSAPRGLNASRSWHLHIFTFLPLLVQKFASRTAQHNMHVFVLLTLLLVPWEGWLSSKLGRGNDVCGSFLLQQIHRCFLRSLLELTTWYNNPFSCVLIVDSKGWFRLLLSGTGRLHLQSTCWLRRRWKYHGSRVHDSLLHSELARISGVLNGSRVQTEQSWGQLLLLLLLIQRREIVELHPWFQFITRTVILR